MEVLRRELFPGVWLRTVHTNKFKSSYLSLTLMVPLSAETASANALIPAVLRRGTAAHPDLESLSAALDELYGGAIEPIVRKKGETQCVGFAASFLDDAYALEGEPVLEGAAALLGELLLRPRTEKGMFYPDYVAGERSNLVDRIRAQVNDKRYYALSRLTQLMCQGEAFGVDKLGDEGCAAALTPRDAILFFSYSGATREAVELLELAQRRKVRTILVTHFPKSPAAAYANVILQCGANEGPLQLGSVPARMAQLFLIDTLFTEVSRRQEDKVEDTRREMAEVLELKHL